MSDRPKDVAPPDEDEFVKGANQAIERAIRVSREGGIATMHERNGKLVQVDSDGQSREIGTLRPL